MSSKILTFGGYALTVGNHAVAASAVNPVLPVKTISYNTSGAIFAVSGPSAALPGQQVYFSVTPGPYAEWTGLKVNGQTVTRDVVFTMPNDNTTVNVIAENIEDIYGGVSINLYEMRVKFNTNFNPKNYGTTAQKARWTQVSSSPNIWTYKSQTVANVNADFSNGRLEGYGASNWEILYGNLAGWDTDFSYTFHGCTGLRKVHQLILNGTPASDTFANCTNLTEAHIITFGNTLSFYNCFSGCTSLRNVSVGTLSDDYSTLTSEFAPDNIGYLFDGCSALKYIPAFTPAGGGQINYTFNNCVNVEGGILNAYNAWKNSIYGAHCFSNCGTNTSGGAAELAQIPSDWK